jgi:formylglycine-generating enzyme required for sulfatase activity
VLRSAGLALPTEEQWEYACRAGSSTPWWTGIGKESLQSGGAAANIADAAALDAKATWSSLREWPEYFDRHPYTAPVDSLLPNPWGLHHVLGNVWEWCEDEYASYSGLESERSTGRTYRGGSYASSYKEARSSVRTQAMPNTSSNVIGIRAARAVE